MPSDFMQQFLAGWGMGQQRLEGQRRNQMMQQAQEQEMYRRQQEEQDRQLRMENYKLQKQELDLRMKREKFQSMADAAAITSNQQQVLPPETQDLGGVTPEAPSAGVLQLGPVTQDRPPIMADIPGAPEGTAPVPLPYMEDIQAQKDAESQRKMREALGMFQAQEGIRAQYREPQKTLDQIRAESKARAEGTREGAPPPAPESGGMNPKQT